MSIDAKSKATTSLVVMKRAEAAKKRMLKAVKKGKILSGPRPRRVKIRA